MDFIDIGLSLTALIILEVVLGIDNLVILSILTEKLPREKEKGEKMGLNICLDDTTSFTRLSSFFS